MFFTTLFFFLIYISYGFKEVGFHDCCDICFLNENDKHSFVNYFDINFLNKLNSSYTFHYCSVTTTYKCDRKKSVVHQEVKVQPNYSLHIPVEKNSNKIHINRSAQENLLFVLEELNYKLGVKSGIIFKF